MGMVPRRSSEVAIAVDESGDGSARLPAVGDVGSCCGIIAAVIYTKPGSNAYDDGVEITVTCEKTGIVVWQETLTTNASKTITGPTMDAYDNDGAARTDGVDIPLASEGVTVTVASGGSGGETGTFQLVWYDAIGR